jgi:hypothetical protein
MFPIGLTVDCLAVLAGGALGASIKNVLPAKLKENLPLLFGVCSMGVGINSIIKVSGMTAVVLAVLVGYIIGSLLNLEQQTTRFFRWLVGVLHLGGQDIDMNFYITAVALFCCSGFGWYSTLTEAIAGDSSIILSKSVLDFFTALIFASVVGFALCAIPLPQIVILLAVFAVGRLLSPYLTTTMFADLSACGGVLTLAAGLRVAKIKNFPLVDMMPALILVMPFSALWSAIMG